MFFSPLPIACQALEVRRLAFLLACLGGCCHVPGMRPIRPRTSPSERHHCLALASRELSHFIRLGTTCLGKTHPLVIEGIDVARAVDELLASV